MARHPDCRCDGDDCPIDRFTMSNGELLEVGMCPHFREPVKKLLTGPNQFAEAANHHERTSLLLAIPSHAA